MCDKQFGIYNDLRMHRRTHGIGQSFPCDVCKKQFSTNRNLKDHIVTHTQGFYVI